MRRPARFSEIEGSLTESEFWDSVGSIEHELLELEESPRHLSATMAAMAMTDGGTIVVGVSDAREIVGCELDQRVLDRVRLTAHACGLEVQLKAIRVDGHPVVLVGVPEVDGRIVTTPDGRLLRRIGSDNQPLVGDALGRFVRGRQERPAEDEHVPGLDPSALDIGLVNRALAGDDRPPVTRRTVMGALVDLGVAATSDPSRDPQPLLAAAVLFASDPTRHAPGATVQLVRRTGAGPEPSPVVAREEVRAPMPKALTATVSFVGKHTASHQAVVGTHRETLAEYPPSVLREALLNALAHRDYGLTGATVDVTVWDDRIEIRSPGPLPGHITLDNMRDEHFSRNRRMMRVLKLLALVEEYGEGVDRMFDEMEARLMEPPHFAASGSSVTVTLYNRSMLSVEDQAWLSLLGHMDLSPQDRRALVIARHEDGVTPRSLRAQVEETRDVEAILRGAVAKGLLVKVGRRGGTRYVLSDEVVMRAGGAGVEARSRKRQMLLDEARLRGSLSTAEAADHLGEGDRALVRQMLADLVQGRELVARGRTRARRYYPR